VTNFLNQQTTFDGQTISHNVNGDVATAFGGTGTYVYDAQNRLTSVSYGGVTTNFTYDGLNRKISQSVVGGATTYNVCDGWNLIEERGAGNALLNSYIYGAGEIVERIAGSTAHFYYQDGLGSTSHVSDAAGGLLESYKYGTFGQTSVYDPAGSLRKNGSSYDVRHLYTGQLWMPQAGLYDLRNRVFSPSLTRFLQPDPIGFAGDSSNLYRYCGNNGVNGSDPMGLDGPVPPKRDDDRGVVVSDTPIDDHHDFGTIAMGSGTSPIEMVDKVPLTKGAGEAQAGAVAEGLAAFVIHFRLGQSPSPPTAREVCGLDWMDCLPAAHGLRLSRCWQRLKKGRRQVSSLTSGR